MKLLLILLIQENVQVNGLVNSLHWFNCSWIEIERVGKGLLQKIKCSELLAIQLKSSLGSKLRYWFHKFELLIKSMVQIATEENFSSHSAWERSLLNNETRIGILDFQGASYTVRIHWCVFLSRLLVLTLSLSRPKSGGLNYQHSLFVRVFVDELEKDLRT